MQHQLPFEANLLPVSVQIILQTVTTLVTGLDRVKQEVDVQKRVKDRLPNDYFIRVMEVSQGKTPLN